MRPVAFGPLPFNAGTEQKIDWIVRALQEVELASNEDPIAVADSYGTDTSFTITRQLNVTAPTASNIAAVLASFLADLRKRGVNKST
jgi:hypothetical protein